MMAKSIYGICLKYVLATVMSVNFANINGKGGRGSRLECLGLNEGVWIQCPLALVCVHEQVPLSHCMNKPTIWVSNQVQHKQACTVTEITDAG